MNRSALKKFIKDYVVPPGYLRLASDFAGRKRIKSVDPRRWWLGEDLAPLAFNAPLFYAAEIPSACITFQKESRAAFRLRGERTVELPCEAEATCHLAVAGTAADAAISGDLDGYRVFELMALDDEAWHIVRFDVPAGGGRLTLKTNDTGEVVVSHPILTKRKRGEDTSARLPRTVIVLMLDGIAVDLLERYGEEWGEKSHIHRFFESGMVCDNAYSQSEWTYPSLYSMMTADSTLRHGCFERFLGKGMEAEQEGTLPQEMMRRGYVTMGFSTSKMYQPAYNSHLGFHRFFYQQFGSELSFPEITDKAVSHLESHRDCSNFLFLDYIDLHAPWNFNSEITDANLAVERICNPITEFARYFTKDIPVEPAGVEALSRRCVARLRDVDLSLSRIFSYLETTGLAEDAVVMLTSDHGDLYRNGQQPLLCRSRTHVPFMFRGPGVSAGKIEGFVSTGVDVMPTLLRVVDGTVNGPGSDGQAVPPYGPVRDHVVCESAYENRYQAAVRSTSHVYHFQCGYEYGDDGKVFLSGPGVAELFDVEVEVDCIDVKASRYDAWNWHHERLLAHLRGIVAIDSWLQQFVK